MEDLFDAVKLGMEMRKVAQEHGALFKNPYPPETSESRAWQSGFDNDLHAWVAIRKEVDADRMARADAAFDELYSALSASRGQWINSVNADRCLKAIDAARDLME